MYLCNSSFCKCNIKFIKCLWTFIFYLKAMLQIRIYDYPYINWQLSLIYSNTFNHWRYKNARQSTTALLVWFGHSLPGTHPVFIEPHPNQHVLDNSPDTISRFKLPYSITSMGGCSKPLTGIICRYGSLLFNTYDFSGSLLPLLSLAKWNKGETLPTIKSRCSLTVDFCSFKGIKHCHQ